MKLNGKKVPWYKGLDWLNVWGLIISPLIIIILLVILIWGSCV